MRTGSLVRVGLYVALASGLLAGCHFHGGMFKATVSRSEDLSAPLAGITALDVTTEVGQIRLEPAETAEARILADIRVRAGSEEKAQELADKVRVTVEPAGETLVIKALKPKGFGHNELSVDLTITAPASLALDCTTNVGDIRFAGFTRRIAARTDVGSIDCAGLRDDAKLQTNVGDIRAAYATDAPAALDFSATTDVGSIEFTGPREISAQVTAETDVGDIHTNRPLTVRGWMNRSVRATLGNGDGQIRLRTDVGSIKIR